MTNLRIPMKTKIRGIQGAPTSMEDIEVPAKSETLKISLKRTNNACSQDDIAQLQNKILILEESLQQAREEAFHSGIEEGKEQLKNEMESVLADEMAGLKKTIIKMISSLEKEFNKLHKPILNLSKEIARRIIAAELQSEEKYDEVLLSQISNIMHEMMDQETITIHVSPQQIDRILKANLEKEVNLPDNIKLNFLKIAVWNQENVFWNLPTYL